MINDFFGSRISSFDAGVSVSSSTFGIVTCSTSLSSSSDACTDFVGDERFFTSSHRVGVANLFFGALEGGEK